MRSDPKREAERWLSQAEMEWSDACFLKESGRFYLALFLAQQSAEKALKAFLFFHDEEPIFTHSVSELLSLAQSVNTEFAILKNARRLDDYYIPTRYPNGLPGDVPYLHYDDLEQVEKALELCESVLNLVKKHIMHS